MTPMYDAATQGHVDYIRVLAELGANVRQATRNGTTPIIIAAQQGHVDCIRVLAELGADVR